MTEKVTKPSAAVVQAAKAGAADAELERAVAAADESSKTPALDAFKDKVADISKAPRYTRRQTLRVIEETMRLHHVPMVEVASLLGISVSTFQAAVLSGHLELSTVASAVEAIQTANLAADAARQHVLDTFKRAYDVGGEV